MQGFTVRSLGPLPDVDLDLWSEDGAGPLEVSVLVAELRKVRAELIEAREPR